MKKGARPEPGALEPEGSRLHVEPAVSLTFCEGDDTQIDLQGSLGIGRGHVFDVGIAGNVVVGRFLIIGVGIGIVGQRLRFVRQLQIGATGLHGSDIGLGNALASLDLSGKGPDASHRDDLNALIAVATFEPDPVAFEPWLIELP